MGDLSEFRGLIFVGTFISIFIGLIGFLSVSGFAFTTYEGKTINPSDYWQVSFFTSFNKTWGSYLDNGTIAHPSTSYFSNWKQDLNDGSGSFGGWYVDIISGYSSPPNGIIYALKYDNFLGIDYNSKMMSFEDESGKIYEYLTKSDLDYVYSRYGALQFNVKNSELSFTLIFYFDTNIYSSPSNAWSNNKLGVLCGIGLDYTRSSWDAFTLIKDILFFNIPNLDPLLTIFISVPMWISIIYISFIIILRAIGAIFGGGA